MILFVLCLTVSVAYSLTEFEKALENAKTYYSDGDYEKAIKELEKAKSFVAESEQGDLIEAYKYLGFSYVAFGEIEKAKAEFAKVIKMDPAHELDKAYVSPKIISVFEQARTELLASGWKPEDVDEGTDEINPVPSPGPAQPEPGPRPSYQPVNKSSAFLRSTLVPGLGQIYKGQTTKGYVYMGLNGLMLINYMNNKSTYSDAKSKYEDEAFRTAIDYDKLWDEYNESAEKVNSAAKMLVIVWAVNIADATLLGWDKVSLSMKQEEETPMLCLEMNF